VHVAFVRLIAIKIFNRSAALIIRHLVRSTPWIKETCRQRLFISLPDVDRSSKSFHWRTRRKFGQHLVKVWRHVFWLAAQKLQKSDQSVQQQLTVWNEQEGTAAATSTSQLSMETVTASDGTDMIQWRVTNSEHVEQMLVHINQLLGTQTHKQTFLNHMPDDRQSWPILSANKIGQQKSVVCQCCRPIKSSDFIV